MRASYRILQYNLTDLHMRLDISQSRCVECGRLENIEADVREQKDGVEMIDYHLHFAQMAAEDQLKAADERRRTKGAKRHGSRVFRLGKRQTAGRERGQG
jgi:hypothetical protein